MDLDQSRMYILEHHEHLDPSLKDKIYILEHHTLALKNTYKRHVDNCQQMIRLSYTKTLFWLGLRK